MYALHLCLRSFSSDYKINKWNKLFMYFSTTSLLLNPSPIVPWLCNWTPGPSMVNILTCRLCQSNSEFLDVLEFLRQIVVDFKERCKLKTASKTDFFFLNGAIWHPRRILSGFFGGWGGEIFKMQYFADRPLFTLNVKGTRSFEACSTWE